MAWVTISEVREIIDTDLADAAIQTFIAGADSIVSTVLGDDSNLPDSAKKEIERWLTAHLMATSREPQIASIGADGVNVTYQGLTGKGLESTFYGQNVLLLDTTGKLASSLQKRNASLIAVTSK